MRNAVTSFEPTFSRIAIERRDASCRILGEHQLHNCRQIIAAAY